MALKYILLSERSQSIQATNYMVSIIWQFGKGKAIGVVKKIHGY